MMEDIRRGLRELISRNLMYGTEDFNRLVEIVAMIVDRLEKLEDSTKDGDDRVQ